MFTHFASRRLRQVIEPPQVVLIPRSASHINVRPFMVLAKTDRNVTIIHGASYQVPGPRTR